MLETIREFALGRLRECVEAEEAQGCRARFYLSFAEAAETRLSAPEAQSWHRRAETELDNLRAAMRWGLEQGDA